MKHLNAEGIIADLDDGPQQAPLDISELKNTIARILGKENWELLLTHGPRGEYTRHRRHEEVCEAVVQLWETGEISCRELWMFAYGDQGGSTLPQADEEATIQTNLDPEIWEKKLQLITETYGFSRESWEARSTPEREAFFSFSKPSQARAYMDLNAPSLAI